MRKAFVPFLLIFLTVSCEKNDIDIQSTGKLKTKYIYSSSEDTEPYSFTNYSYDSDWNLVKELISDYPKPIYASYKYSYNNNGELTNKKHYVKIGENYPDQTESSFTLVEEYKYIYSENKKVELEYNENELTDSVVSLYSSNLLVSESHYDIVDQKEWSIVYEYDSNGNLKKETSQPNGSYFIYEYENSKIQNIVSYDHNGSILSETTYNYIISGDTEIIEVYVGDFLSGKTTKKNGKIVEIVKYHPTFIGSEWYCYKYEYF